jgi:hypothetical protein
MRTTANITQLQANLKATAILDIDHQEVRALAERLSQAGESDRSFVQRAHLCLCQMVRPVYRVATCFENAA